MPNRIRHPRALARELAATRLLAEAWNGDRRAALDVNEAMSGRPTAAIQEAFATPDLFVTAVGDVLHREILARYDDYPVVWPQYASRTTLRDFKPKALIDFLGGRASLDLVPELSEFPMVQSSRGIYQFQLAKYGDRFAYSWEAGINDELGELQQWPANFAAAARDTESKIAASQLCTSAGPNPAFFKSANGNLLAGNPVLSEAAVTAALTAIKTRRDSQNRPIVLKAAVLVVPPELEFVAKRVVGATEVRDTVGSTLVVRPNPLAGIVTVAVDPWLSIINTTSGATSWYLMPAPNQARPAIVVGFLAGYETPDLRVKADTGQRLGGGAIGMDEGSFEIDDVQFRVRHVAGAGLVDPKQTAASNGTGS